MRAVTTIGLFALLFIAVDIAHAQRAASPRGEAATQIGGDWIVVDYGRPILRGRTGIFGEGDTYGDQVKGDAPVWRTGANKSTRLMTEVGLQFGEHMLPAGEYSLFVDLGADGWTLIVSSHAAKNSGREEGDGLWGSYNYTADKDVLRVPMIVDKADMSIDQFTVSFLNVTEMGGVLAVIWETTFAMVNFTVAK